MDQSQSRTERPLRAAVFDTVPDADVAVAALLADGFTAEQITVMCSAEGVQQHYARFEHQDPAGTFTPRATMTGGAIGAALGGLAAVAGAITTGGVSLLVAGGLALWTGGVLGGLVGAMMTRGVEKELADFYDQALTQGKILVAVEVNDPAQLTRLNRAAEILARHGERPLSLREG
jgi:hypothetical protein